MIDCQSLSFSRFYHQKRIAIANKILGEKTVKKIIALAFYFLGASRKAISELMNIPYDTFKSFTQRVEQEGVSSLLERRLKYHSIQTIELKTEKKIKTEFKDDFLVINFGEDAALRIPSKNTHQIKTILLTMVDNRLLEKNTAADLLGYAPMYVQRLSSQLRTNDIGILLDKRHGQKEDYVFTPEKKAEIIQQFAANVALGNKTSSIALAEDIKVRCGLGLSPRTIRFHIKKMGLSNIIRTLPELIQSLKKTAKLDK